MILFSWNWKIQDEGMDSTIGHKTWNTSMIHLLFLELKKVLQINLENEENAK